MKFTKILAAAMSFTMVCGAETIMARPYVFAEVPSAYAEEDDQEMTDFYYEGAFYCEEYGDHVVVRRFEDPGANIVIPGEIHGLPVTKIGTTEENTYPNNNKEQYEVITSVVVPDSVKIIGNGMFKDLKNLKTVKLGSGVEYIGQRAFANSGITQIALPKGLKKIDSAMFMNCKSLTSVDLPSTLTEIGEFVFQGMFGEFFWFGAQYYLYRLVWQVATWLRPTSPYYANILINNGYGIRHRKDQTWPLSTIEFEGHRFPAPADPHAYLSDLYRNYMELPPESKRKVHAIYVHPQLNA